MKALFINGSPRINGNTSIAIKEMTNIFDNEHINYEVIQIGNECIRGCIACGKCKEINKCVFNDLTNEVAAKFKEADALIIASPVYYASGNATLIALLTRLFHSTNYDKTMKVGASIVVARRGGCSSTFDELNKFFTISGMPIASSQYWNSVHGLNIGEANEDEEGKQTMRTLARNVIFLMRSIELGKKKYGLPEVENRISTNFIKK